MYWLFDSLKKGIPNTICFIKNKVILMLLLTFYLIVFSNLFFFLPKNIFSNITLISFIYVLINLWFYFINIYEYSNYTTSIQRFWKRTFMLFWLIEGFLFIIFLYLWLFSPQETSFFIDPYNQNNTYYIMKKEFIVYLIPLITLILILYLLLFFKKKSNINILLLLATIIVIYILIVELEFFIQILNFLSIDSVCFLDNSNALNSTITDSISNTYSSVSAKFDLDFNFNLKGSSIQQVDLTSFTNYELFFKKRTDIFFFNLIVFLKFWHIILITLLFGLTVHKVINKKKLSMDIISANLQNYIYVLFFFFLNFIFFFKKYVYIYLKYVYFYFFENYSLVYYFLSTINEFLLFFN